MTAMTDIVPSKIVLKVEEEMNPAEILCTTYQMRNFYRQFADGLFSNLDVMNYMQHQHILKYIGKGSKVLDVCCGRSLMLPLLRWYKKNIHSYTGVDICESNMREASRWSGIKNIEGKQDYYPFSIEYVLSNVAQMTEHASLKDKQFDLIIYTSSIEHMQREAGAQSLRECFKLLAPRGTLFISCPNTQEKEDPYDTQYAAHLYEWDVAELSKELIEIGFKIKEKFGLVMKKRKMDEFFEIDREIAGVNWSSVYKIFKNYMPTAWLCAVMPIAFPNVADEVAIVCMR